MEEQEVVKSKERLEILEKIEKLEKEGLVDTLSSPTNRKERVNFMVCRLLEIEDW